MCTYAWVLNCGGSNFGAGVAADLSEVMHFVYELSEPGDIPAAGNKDLKRVLGSNIRN